MKRINWIYVSIVFVIVLSGLLILATIIANIDEDTGTTNTNGSSVAQSTESNEGTEAQETTGNQTELPPTEGTTPPTEGTTPPTEGGDFSFDFGDLLG